MNETIIPRTMPREVARQPGLIDGFARAAADEHLPALELEPGADSGDALRAHLAGAHGLELAVDEPAGRVGHGIMNRRLTLWIHPCRHLRGRAAGSDRLRWIEAARRSSISCSSNSLVSVMSLITDTKWLIAPASVVIGVMVCSA